MKTIPGRSEIHQAPKVSLNTFDDCVKELLDPICVIVRTATPVKKLPIIDKWAKELKKTWTQALTNFAPALDSAIEAWVTKGDDKALVASTMAYVALPGRVLVDSSRLKAVNGPLILHLPGGEARTVQVGDPADNPVPRKPPSPSAPDVTSFDAAGHEQQAARCAKQVDLCY